MKSPMFLGLTLVILALPIAIADAIAKKSAPPQRLVPEAVQMSPRRASQKITVVQEKGLPVKITDNSGIR